MCHSGGLRDWCWFVVYGNDETAPANAPGVLDEGNTTPEVADTAEKFS
jgi:hypothetical protein